MDKNNFINNHIPISLKIATVCIVLVVVMAIIIVPIYLLSSHYNGLSLESIKAEKLSLQEVILDDLASIEYTMSADLNIVNNDAIFRRFINNPTSDNLDQAKQRLHQFMVDKDYYDQVRYIDESGQEVIRMNKVEDAIVQVEKDDLQNKSDRYYFTEIMAQSDGEIYRSPLDLNVEYNKVELPPKPMIRLGLKVYDESNNVRGILIFNYEGKAFVKSFMKLASVDRTIENYVLDASGNILFHPNNNITWPQYNPNGLTLEALHPGLISQMQPSEHFVSIDQHHLVYSYYPSTSATAQNPIIFVTEIDEDIIPSFSVNFYILLISLWLFLTLIITLYIRQKHLKQAIISLKHTLFKGLEQNNVVAILTDQKGRIIYVNNAFERITGYTFDMVKGKSPSLLQSGQLSNEDYAKLWHTIKSGQNWNGEFYNRCRDGSFYWADAQISPILNDKGQIAYFLSLQTNITKAKDLIKRYYNLAIKDPLTGAYNRNVYNKESQDILDQIDIHENHYLFMLDIDHFKKINDRFGHTIGDEVLEYVANSIMKHIRDDDVLIRYGGEEFVIIVDMGDKQSAILFAERLRVFFETTPPKTSVGDVPLTVSIGITNITSQSEDLNTIINRADEAMYEAKESGRNQIIFRNSKVKS